MALGGYPDAEAKLALERSLGVEPSSNRWIALVSTASSDATAGTELSGNGYARQAITFGTMASRACANTNAPSFTASGGNWSAAVGIEIYDASTSGNRKYWMPMTTPKTVEAGDTLQFAIGEIVATLTANTA